MRPVLPGDNRPHSARVLSTLDGIGEVAITVAQLYLLRMLQRTLPAGCIAPCLPTKTDKLPSGGQWLHEIKHDGAVDRRPAQLFSL